MEERSGNSIRSGASNVVAIVRRPLRLAGE